MQKGWIIYSKESKTNHQKDTAFDWMVDEARQVNLQCEIIFQEDLLLEIDKGSPRILIKGQKAKLPDFALVRSYCSEIVHFLNEKGVKLYNKLEPMNRARNKWLTATALSILNIPQATTLLCYKNEYDYNLLSNLLGSEIILKNLQGSQGEDVFLVQRKEEYTTLSEQLNDIFIAQPLIRSSYGVDIRVHVIGGTPVAAVKRIAKVGFKSNYSQGASFEDINLDGELIEISRRAAVALKLDIAGVDILYGDEGYLVCEVNAIPAFRTIKNYNIPKSIFQFISSNL